MADPSDFLGPLAATGSQGMLREALVSRVPYVIADTENPADLVALDTGTGGLPWALVFEGRVFALDPADTTTAHDGLTTIVTDDGYRYKVETVAGSILAVLDKDTTAPPTSPAIGDAYLVLAGATGDWASHPDEIAIWTARGWRYAVPAIGMLVFVEDELGFYHYDSAGDWTSGLGSSVLAANSVRASRWMGGRTHWVVVNQTTNTPPGSPATGVAYIVGPSPTGAWAGNTGQIAVWEVNAWVFYSPAEGWTAYDQALNINYIFNGSWIGQASGYDSIQQGFAAASSSPSATGSTAYTYSATTAPTTSNVRYVDPQTMTIQAAYAGQTFEIEYSCALGGSNTTGVFAVFLDSEATARDWRFCLCAAANSTPGAARAIFRIALPDTTPHTLRIMSFANNGLSGWSRRHLIARRLA